MSLCTLDQEFSSLRGIFDDPTCSERDRTAAAWRWGDCHRRHQRHRALEHRGLRGQAPLLLDRGLGMSVGNHPDDLVALRQVLALLEEGLSGV